MALLTLALQLGLSFGHLHAHAHRPAFDAPAGAATPHPPDGDDDHDSRYCATYAINALLGGAQVAAAPTIPAPAARTASEVAKIPTAVCVGSRHDGFRSRAPPLA
jgi:hypothetical protein